MTDKHWEKAETRVMHLQVKEHQRLLKTTTKTQEARRGSEGVLEDVRGNTDLPTLNLNFQTPKL